MKTLLFAVLSLTSIFAHANTSKSIYVSCTCNYYIDFLLTSDMAHGQQTNPTQLDIDNCKIVNGRVVEGCGFAIMNAQWNCQKESRKYNPDQLRSSGYIQPESCIGSIE